MVAIIGSSWLTVRNIDTGERRLDEKDDHVCVELKWGLARPSVPVIPILLDDTKMPTSQDLPPAIQQLAKCQAVRVRVDPEFDRDVEHLIAVLRSALQ